MSARMMVATVKRRATSAMLLLLVAALTTVMADRPLAGGQPPAAITVIAVPWQGSRAKPHAVTQNGTIVLQAVASTGGDGNPVSLTSGSWDPGDGSGPQNIAVWNSRVLELSHTYTGDVGTPYTATISVTDTNNVTYTDTFKVQVQPTSLDTQANMAIDRSLWYNHKTMNLDAFGGFTLGFWNDTDANASTSAAVQAFEVNGHRTNGSAAQDPYVDDVARGLRYLERHVARVALGATTTHAVGSPGLPVSFNHATDGPADVISPNLQLNRGSYGETISQQGSDTTQWLFGSCAAPIGLTYGSFNDLFWDTFWFRGITGNKYDKYSVPGQTVCLLDLTTGVAYDLNFTSWAGYGEGYAIAYWGGIDYYNYDYSTGTYNTGPFNPGQFAYDRSQYSGGLVTTFVPDLQGHAGTPADPNPDSNGNGYGLQTDGGSIVYVGGQIVDAFVASGTPTATAVVGTEAGRTYADIVQDLMDAYAWGQTDPASLMPNNHSPNGMGGGWIYNWNDNYDNIDSSSSGWWGVAAHAAEVWHLTVPQWVKDTNLNGGIPQVQNADGSCGYRNGSPAWSTMTDTTACMIMLSADGQARTSARFSAAETWMTSSFGNVYSNYPGAIEPTGSVYSMYNMTKAMRLAKDASGNSAPITLAGGTLDWYGGLPVPGNPSDPHNGIAYNLILNQRPDGKLAPQNAPGVNDGLANSWGALILSPALFENGPTAVCSVDTTIVCAAGTPAGAGSCGTGAANTYATVHFDGSQSTQGDNAIASYSWNFRDGGSTVDATTAAASTSFGTTGTYNVQLTVTDAHNISSTATCPVRVTSAALAPIADAGGPYTMCMGTDSVVLNATHSIGRGSNIQTYAWDFTTPVDFSSTDAATSTTDQTTYFNHLGPGTYDVGLRITDDASPVNTVTKFTTVTVKDCTPPVISVPANISVITQNPAGTSVSYAPPTVLDNVDGTTDALTCTSAPTAGLASGANFPVGTTTITCNATDHAGNAATPKSFTITVSNNTPPVVTVPASFTVEATGPAGKTVTFTATANDAEDGVLAPVCTPASPSAFGINPTTSRSTTVTCVATDSGGLSATGSFTVTVQDTTPPVLTLPAPINVHGTSASGAVVTYSASAADIVDVADPFVCDHASGSIFPISATTVTCSSTDRHGNMSTGRFQVTVFNTPPVAVADAAGTFSGTPVTINVLANDTDADHDVLTVTSISLPHNGVAVLNADGTVTYSPAAGFAGTDTFTYSIGDGLGGAATATVSVTVVKRAATVTAGGGTKVYGTTPDPAFSATTQTGFLAGDVAGITLASTRAAGENVANYATTATATGGNVANYTVTSVAGNFSITPKAVTVTAGGGTKVYGTNDPALSATTQVGLTAADVASVTLSSSRAAGETVATYATTASAVGTVLSNYTVNLVPGTFSITKASATVTAGGGTKVYGTNDPALSPAVESGFTAADALTIALSSTRDPGAAVGNYATHASAVGAALSNYNVTYPLGSFSITPAPATVTAGGGTKVYGTSDPAITATATGFAAADGITVSATRTSGEAVGSYVTTATAAGTLTNYTVTYVPGTFSITPASTTAGVSAPTITYAANGVVTVTVSSTAGTVLGNVTLTVDGGAPLTGALSGGSATFTLLQPNAGDHPLVASFAAHGNFAASSATGNLHVNKSPTATTLTSTPSPQAAGQTVTLTAKVVSVAPGSGVPNGTVTFMDGATTLGTAPVNASGVAIFTTTSLAVGPHSITATYSGSSNYILSAASAASQLIYGYPAGGGSFVIGNNNAILGGSVTFWGAQWEKLNSMTGGSSTASFKGFATGPTPPTVGATFTAAPGNSAPSPSAVPTYIGIIVTSKVTKSGSNISGTIVALVVVKVDPGYEGNPGHAGTGTIVAVLP